MKRSTTTLLLLTMLVIAGCTHSVNVALQPDYETSLQPDNELTKVESKIHFIQGDFADKRPNSEKLASFKQQMHTYNLYEERPVNEAFFDGLDALLSLSGHQWSNDKEGEIQVNLEFINCQAERNAGFISVGASSTVQIKLDFVDTRTDETLYTQIYTGSDERSQALIGLIGMVKKSIDESMIDCIQSVGNDANLARALEKYKSSQ